MLAHDLAEDALEIADAQVPLVKGRMDPGAVEAKRLQVVLCQWLARRARAFSFVGPGRGKKGPSGICVPPGPKRGRGGRLSPRGL